jgi:hypothetical protein
MLKGEFLKSFFTMLIVSFALTFCFLRFGDKPHAFHFEQGLHSTEIAMDDEAVLPESATSPSRAPASVFKKEKQTPAKNILRTIEVVWDYDTIDRVISGLMRNKKPLTKLADSEKTIPIRLFSNLPSEAIVEKMEPMDLDSTVVYGTLKGLPNSKFKLVSGNDMILGEVWTEKYHYEIKYSLDGKNVINEIRNTSTLSAVSAVNGFES